MLKGANASMFESHLVRVLPHIICDGADVIQILNLGIMVVLSKISINRNEAPLDLDLGIRPNCLICKQKEEVGGRW